MNGRAYIPALWWYEAEQSSVTTEGRKTADAYTVRIPYITVLVKKDDYLVKGQCSVQMKTAKDLAGTEHFKVSAANYNRYGGNPHIKVTGVHDGRDQEKRSRSGSRRTSATAGMAAAGCSRQGMEWDASPCGKDSTETLAEAQKYVDQTCIDRMEPETPFRSGTPGCSNILHGHRFRSDRAVHTVRQKAVLRTQKSSPNGSNA